MLDPLYNALFAGILISWLLSYKPGRQWLLDILIRYRKIVFVISWLLFASLLAAFIINYGFFDTSHDVDDAVLAAVDHFIDGGNPYVDEVIPRFPEKYNDEEREFVNGTYNYLPIDLFVYSGMQLLLSPLGTPHWFVVSNAIFAAIAALLLWRILRIEPLLLFPVSASVFFVFSFDNVCLTALLVIGGLMFFYKPERKRTHLLLALFLFGLATLTKPFAAIIPLVIALGYFQSAIREKDWKFMLQVASVLIAIAAIAIAICLPFGFNNVVDSAILFHMDPDQRENTISGGTILFFLMGSSSLFLPVSICMVGIIAILSLRMHEFLNRLLAVESVFLAVMINSTHSAILLPAIILFAGLLLPMPNSENLLKSEAPGLTHEQ